MPKIKILVSYHKPAYLLKSEILTPVHLGRALATEASKDGQMSKADYQWMLDNMIGDDTGDNISHLNREFCELTVIYWAWKNYDKLGNPDYIGFMHYRRVLSFLAPKDQNVNFTKDILPEVNSFNDNFTKAAEKYDFFIPKPHSVEDASKSQNIIEHYGKYTYHYPQGLDILKNTLKKQCPFLYGVFDDYFEGKNAYFTSIFIMKRNDFMLYAQTIFNILLKVKKELTLSNANSQEYRAIAYIGEYLTGLYLYYLKSKRKTLELARYFIKNTNRDTALFPAFKKKNIPVFFSTDDNYSPYSAVLIQSIMNHANTKNNYDIVILKERLSADNEKKLLDLQNGHDNISIRIYDVSSFMNNKKFHLCAHFTIATYYRMFAPSIFANYKKIIYLDIDTIVLDDIANLYHHNIQNYLLAAVKDYGLIAKFKTGKYETEDYFREKIGVNDVTKEYFQAGILLFNIQKMRDEQIEEKLINTALRNTFNYVDQDVLNKVCHGNVLFLDSSWNVQVETGSKKGIMALLPIKIYHDWSEDRKNPKIIHYASYCKPWNTPSSDLADIWWKYARQTPFYEQIMYENLNMNSVQNVTQNITQQISQVTNMDIVRDVANFSKNRFNYYRCRLLANLTFGRMRAHYINKKKAMKQKIQRVKTFMGGGKINVYKYNVCIQLRRFCQSLFLSPNLLAN